MHTFGLFARGSFAQNKSIAHTIDRVYCSGSGARAIFAHNGSARQTIQWFSTPRYSVCGRPRQRCRNERAHAIQPASPEPGWLLRNLQSICDFFFLYFSFSFLSLFLLFSLRFGFIVSILADTKYPQRYTMGLHVPRINSNTENKTIASVAIAFRCSSVVRSFGERLIAPVRRYE